jgi:serine protease inhibitor
MVLATAVGVSKPAFEMVVDHPFFFAITEQQSGAMLFAGVVMDPTSTGGAQ